MVPIFLVSIRFGCFFLKIEGNKIAEKMNKQDLQMECKIYKKMLFKVQKILKVENLPGPDSREIL